MDTTPATVIPSLDSDGLHPWELSRRDLILAEIRALKSWTAAGSRGNPDIYKKRFIATAAVAKMVEWHTRQTRGPVYQCPDPEAYRRGTCSHALCAECRESHFWRNIEDSLSQLPSHSAYRAEPTGGA